MKRYQAQNLLAASSAITVSSSMSNDDSNSINNNEPFLDNVYVEYTTAKPTTPRPNDDESLAAEKNQIDEEMGFSVVIVLLFGLGLIVNTACLVSLRRHRSTFHQFLKACPAYTSG